MMFRRTFLRLGSMAAGAAVVPLLKARAEERNETIFTMTMPDGTTWTAAVDEIWPASFDDDPHTFKIKLKSAPRYDLP